MIVLLYVDNYQVLVSELIMVFIIRCGINYCKVAPPSERSVLQSDGNVGSSTKPLSFSSMKARDVIWWLSKYVSYLSECSEASVLHHEYCTKPRAWCRFQMCHSAPIGRNCC